MIDVKVIIRINTIASLTERKNLYTALAQLVDVVSFMMFFSLVFCVCVMYITTLVMYIINYVKISQMVSMNISEFITIIMDMYDYPSTKRSSIQ